MWGMREKGKGRKSPSFPFFQSGSRGRKFYASILSFLSLYGNVWCVRVPENAVWGERETSFIFKKGREEGRKAPTVLPFFKKKKKQHPFFVLYFFASCMGRQGIGVRYTVAFLGFFCWFL